MELISVVLGVVGLGLGIGVSFLKFIPKLVKSVLGIVAVVVLAVMFWDAIQLPAIELLQTLTRNAWVLAISLGFLLGKEVGDIF